MGKEQSRHFVAFMGILGSEQKSHIPSIADLSLIVHQIHVDFRIANLDGFYSPGTNNINNIKNNLLDFLKSPCNNLIGW